MKYLEVPLTEDRLRKMISKMRQWDSGQTVMFLETKDGKQRQGVVRDIFPEEFSLLPFTHDKVTVKYEDVDRWVIMTKVGLAEEVVYLREELKAEILRGVARILV